MAPSDVELRALFTAQLTAPVAPQVPPNTVDSGN